MLHWCDFTEKKRNDNDEIGFQDGWAALESKGDDNIRELFLRKIDTLQLQVRKLKARIDKVVNDNPGKFSSLNRLSLPATCEALNSFEQNPNSPLENGDRVPVQSLYTRHMSKGDVGGLLPESIVSSHEGANPVSDIIENSILPQVGVSCESVSLIGDAVPASNLFLLHFRGLPLNPTHSWNEVY